MVQIRGQAVLLLQQGDHVDPRRHLVRRLLRGNDRQVQRLPGGHAHGGHGGELLRGLRLLAGDLHQLPRLVPLRCHRDRSLRRHRQPEIVVHLLPLLPVQGAAAAPPGGGVDGPLRRPRLQGQGVAVVVVRQTQGLRPLLPGGGAAGRVHGGPDHVLILRVTLIVRNPSRHAEVEGRQVELGGVLRRYLPIVPAGKELELRLRRDVAAQGQRHVPAEVVGVVVDAAGDLQALGGGPVPGQDGLPDLHLVLRPAQGQVGAHQHRQGQTEHRPQPGQILFHGVSSSPSSVSRSRARLTRSGS